ncbi:hypothetical protein ACFU7X_37995 [Streptomyces chartreusis]|uniref:hypothetical protein n=1 Tax=Streptomyces chartreusis TaxID=1969 RepID=UPI0036B8D3D2
MSSPAETLATPAPEPDPESRLGPIGRARASLAAIEILLRLREDQQEPTTEDLAALRHWPGWGPLAPALAPNREGTWAEIGEQLQLLLSPREYRQAEQGTPTAYYTPDRIAEACWTALRDLNFTGGRILEPGCGAGTFINHTPDRMPVEWFGVERDPTTAGIAELLHPDAQIINARLQDAGLQSNSVDAVLGNVPYGNFQVHDKTAPKAVTDSIHNYFIWRSVQALRPGGVAILLTSRYTMDSQDDSARRAIARHADLLGAVRLPNGALAEGGTGVLADILIVRRRDTDGPVDDSWMDVSEVPGVDGQYANNYFLAHPENVLGTFEQGRAAQYGHTLAVKAPEDQDLAAALAGAFDGITAAARDAGRDWRVAVGAQPFTEDNLPFPVREDGRKEGSFHLVDGKPHEVVDGELVVVERAGKELPKLIRLRDATLKLIGAETDHDTPDEQLEPLRAEVNRLYDAYVKVHGPINRYTLAEGQVDEETGEKAVSRRYPRLGGFRRDPDFVSVLALEDFDDETQTADKAGLLTRRVNRRIERPTSAETPEEALSLCLNFKNKIDVPVIAQLLGIDEDQVADELGELVFPDPDTGELLTKGAYLSGPVVEKLERAEFLLSQGREDLQRHVDALREVQPEPLPPEDIRAKLGAPWIPVEDVTAFAEELLGVPVEIIHVAKTATWNVDMPMTIPEAATSEWGTARVNAFELLDLALNGQAPKVYDTFRLPDGGSRRVRNDKETMLAESKMTALMRRFAGWVWEDPDRADRLSADYNRIFNSWVLPKHDGSHLTVDGMDPEFTPYSHQWDFVQRVLSAEEGSLCPYPVGAGKTATMFMTALKLKQLGLVNKPMIVVPNHLLEQISRDGKRLFPNARILMAGKKDLADARSRMLFAARCATGDWDAIVMTHNSFGRLGVHPVTEATYLEELANDYRVALGAIDGDDANQRRIKEIAKMVDRFDARASDLRSKATDAGVTYENLGVDFLQIDEAHLFKNLAMPATTEGMALGKPSKRATDLDLKLIVTRERTGRDNVTALYSGTFISNSVREMLVFKHYTMPKRLEKLGLGSPDAWAANFIHFESRPEVGVDGVSFRLKRRPVEYTNADEAMALFAEVAELRPPESFDIKRPKRVERFVEIEATPNLVNYVGSISNRIDLIQQGKVKPFEDNMLNVITDGRKAALDLELVGMEPDGPGKAGAIIRNVLQVHERTKDLKLPGDPDDVAGGLQVVFCDLGTPSKERGSQVYGKVRRGLIEGLPGEGLPGIPRERIRFIHDYNSDLAKEQLFSDCRAGKVSVLFMSSEKGGTGVNVQTRGVALHHADPPHKPAEWEQREGRLWRPGNGLIDLDMEVEFFRYLALNSFDSYMFQQLERKQRPIVQIMSGRKVGRVIQEIDPVGASFGQAKAIVAGNPMLMELADVNGELTVLLNEADGHRQAQSRMKRKVEVLSESIAEAERTLPGRRAMADALAAAGDDETWRTADGRVIDADDVPGVLAQTAQGSKPTLDLDMGYTWRGVNVGFTWHRRQQFNNVAYESWAHLVAGGHEVDVRLNLSWFGKGQAWRIVKALGEAADEAMAAPAEIEAKVAKSRAALEDTRSHIGRPFDKHAELEAVRERKAELEARIASSAAESGRESGSGPQFDPGAAGAEMTEADMAMHDAKAMVGMMGGSAVVVSDGQFVGSVSMVDGTPTDLRTPDLADLGQYEEALRALTEAAAADSDVTAWAQIDANEGDRFREAFADWAQEWALDQAQEITDPEARPAWLRAFLDYEPETRATRSMLVAEAAGIVWQQARATPDPEPAPAPSASPAEPDAGVDETAADSPTGTAGTAPETPTSPAPAPEATGTAAPAPQPPQDNTPVRLTDPQLWAEGVRTLTAAAADAEQLRQAARANDEDNFRIAFADWAEDWMFDQYSGPTTDQWPQWARAYLGGSEQAYQDRERLHAEVAAAVYPQLRAEPDAAPAPTPAAAATEPQSAPDTTTVDTAEQAPPQGGADPFGGRIMVGHIGGPQPARTHQFAGWAIMAVLSDDQVRGLVSAVAVDNQPVSTEPGVMPTDRVREWIAEQQQTPTTAFYASTSSDLPPAVRGDGDVRLSTRTDGLIIEQGDVSTTILWEELPAWIDTAVAHNTANRDPYEPAWRYGNLSAEIHFRRDENNQAIRTAMDALADALRETTPPTDEQLAEARDRFAPPAAAADPDVLAEESAPQEPEQQLPEGTKPVPGAEGYYYTEESRTVRLYTEPGEQVGTAKWSYTKYRYLGDVQGDTVRGTEEGAVAAKRMANHHAVVYGERVHRPPLDDQGRDPVWILHNGDDTLVFGVSPEDDTARAAMWTGGGFKESRKVSGWYLPRTWKQPTRKERVDTAVRVLAAAGRAVQVCDTREERRRTEEPKRLPFLDVTPPDLEQVPQLYAAEPYTTDNEMRTDLDRLTGAFGRWSELPTVQAYHNQDHDARPDGFGRPDNPIAELRSAFLWAEGTLGRGSATAGPDEVVRRIYAVAAWCQALEPAVEQDLLDPLQEVYEAAHHLTARLQATIEDFVQAAAGEEQTADAVVESNPQDNAPAPEAVVPTDAPADVEQSPAQESTGEQSAAEEATNSPDDSAPPNEPVTEAAPATPVEQMTFDLDSGDDVQEEETSNTVPADEPAADVAQDSPEPEPDGDQAVEERDAVDAAQPEEPASVASEPTAGEVTQENPALESEADQAAQTEPSAESEVIEGGSLPVTSRTLAPSNPSGGWWEYGYEGRTYTATNLPDEMRRGRLTTLVGVIVDEDGELVGRTTGRPFDRDIIWYHNNPGVPEPSVLRWIHGWGESTWPEYSDEERAYMMAGPPVEQMTFDLDSGDDVQEEETSNTVPADEPAADVAQDSPEPEPDGDQAVEERDAVDAAQPEEPASLASEPTAGETVQDDAPAPQEPAAAPPTEPGDVDDQADVPSIDVEDPPELDVVLLDVDAPPPGPAEPYTTDTEAQADIDRLREAFAQWDALPTVQHYYDADRQQRPDSSGAPTNPIAQLAAAYQDTAQFMGDDPAGTPEDLVRQVHTVALWSGALEPVVGNGLRGPLEQIREAAALLASRSQATIEAFETELAALAAESAEQGTPAQESAADETEPHQQEPVDVDDEPETRTEPEPSEPAADTGPSGPSTAAQTTPDSVTDDDAAPNPQDTQEPPAAVDDPAPDPVPQPQETAAAIPDEGMHEARREASFLEQDRPPTTDDDQQTSEPGTAAAPPDPSPASEDAPGDETAYDASEEETMTTPPLPETTNAPDEPPIEEPPEPQRYFETAPLAADSGYELSLSGLDGQSVDSGELRIGSTVVTTVQLSSGGEWFARLAVDDLPADVTTLTDSPQEAANRGAVLYSAFTGTPYGAQPTAAPGDSPLSRADALRAELQDAARQHRTVIVDAAARVSPDYAKSPQARELAARLVEMGEAVIDAYNSRQMAFQLDAVQQAVNSWGVTLPVDPTDRKRQLLAFPLAHLLYDTTRLQQRLQATLDVAEAERAATPQQTAAAAAPEDRQVPPTAEDGPAAAPLGDVAGPVTEAPETAQPESDSPGLTDSQTPEVQGASEPADEPTEPAAPASTPEENEMAAPSSPIRPEEATPSPDIATEGARKALEDAGLLGGGQPDAGAAGDPSVPEGAELPLWAGPETSSAAEAEAGPLDIRAEFAGVMEAWTENIPAEQGSAEDLLSDLDADLQTLQRLLADAVQTPQELAAPAAAPTASTEPAPAEFPGEQTQQPDTLDPQQQAEAVNAALRQADAQSVALQDLPEWQRIQTVRGAFGHLFRVLRERAGEGFNSLIIDGRVGDFFRKVSLKVCEKVAVWAQAGADRFRRDDGYGTGPDAERRSDLPSAEALLRLGDEALSYSALRRGGGTPPASSNGSAVSVDVPALRKLGEALERPLPTAANRTGPRVSTAAARGRSATARKGGAKKSAAGGTEQAGHLRRDSSEQQTVRKPTK